MKTRLLILALALTAITLALVARWLPHLAALVPGVQVGPPLPAATPAPPPDLAPAAALPEPPPGLVLLAHYAAQADFAPAGSGFLLRLPTGQVVGVGAAHSVAWGRAPQRLALAVRGAAEPAAVFAALYGEPGTARTGHDLSVDYVLLRLEGEPPAGLAALLPDTRGLPEVGERVALADTRPGAGWHYATTLSAGPEGAWALMDETFDARGLSGAPVLSAHTGQVVGLAIAAASRGERLLIGFHPVGSLLQHAAAASTFPDLAGYRP